MLTAFRDEPAAFGASPTFRFARAVSSASSTSTWSRWPACHDLHLDGRDVDTFPPRWLAALGYLLAALLLIGSSFLRWSFALFPLWVLLLSIHILASGLGRRVER